ncbi:MAG: AAA family ATPase [Proteobacteria bacterium]|nr:AAA family ATPase [Pseudomonadota bacterium]
MFREYFGIEENPFSNTPDPKYLFMSDRHQEALAHLQYGAQGSSGFVLLTGEVGTGKTTLCRCLVEQLPDHIDLALCLNPSLNETELLATICDELGIDVSDARPDSVKDHMDALNKHLLDGHARGRRTVLIIDEAQNLGRPLLERVRLLTNLETSKTKLLQVILIGQPELREILGRGDMRQLSQRITARYHLDPMSREEADNYIRHRLQVGGLDAGLIAPGALTEIHARSGGIPRLINSICERSLLGAYAGGKTSIDASLARTAAQEVLGREFPGGGSLGPPPQRRQGAGAIGWLTGIGLAAATIAGTVVLSSMDTVTVPPPDAPVTRTEKEISSAPIMAARLEAAAAPEMPPARETEPETRTAAGPAKNPEPGPAEEDLVAAVIDRLIAQGAVKTPPKEPKETPIASVAPGAPAAPMKPPGNPGGEPGGGKGAPSAANEKITLENLFRHPGVKGGLDTAVTRLFGLWNRKPPPLAGLNPCAEAQALGLECLRHRGSWASMENIDRPLLISLVNDKGDRRFAVVTAIDGRTATLALGDSEIAAGVDALQVLWSGEFLVLWEPLPGVRPSLRSGMRGRDVAWLRGRLAEILGQHADLENADLFDERLKERVIAFQKNHRLKSDGIVGTMTQIQLAGAIGGSAVPRLRKRP